eukprot:gene1603-45284_t
MAPCAVAAAALAASAAAQPAPQLSELGSCDELSFV